MKPLHQVEAWYKPLLLRWFLEALGPELFLPQSHSNPREQGRVLFGAGPAVRRQTEAAAAGVRREVCRRGGPAPVELLRLAQCHTAVCHVEQRTQCDTLCGI